MKRFSFLGRKLASLFLVAAGIAPIHQSVLAQSRSCEGVLSAAIVKKADGLLPLYQFQENDGIVIGIPKNDLDQNYILSTYFDQGVNPTVGNYLQSSIIRFEQSGNIIRVIKTFANLTYTKGSPLSRTRDTSLSDSRLLEIPVVRCSDENYVFASISTTALRALSVPAISALSQSIRGLALTRIAASTNAIESYEDNINISVDLSVDVPGGVVGAANNSSFAVRFAHSIIKLPDTDFKTRAPDPSVGFFAVNNIDLARLNQIENTQFIHRWRLEKKDPSAALSEPVKPIVFWIENTTPYGFLDPIRNGVLAWNKAFEAAGFLNAIKVEIQPDDAKWDAGNLNYNVIRWEASPFYNRRLGLGPSIVDPRTGEILAADILLNFTGVARRFEHWLALSDYDWVDSIPVIDDQDSVPVPKVEPNPAVAFNDLSRRSQDWQDNRGISAVNDALNESYNNEYASASRNKILTPQTFEKPSQKEFSKLVRFSDVVARVSGRQEITPLNKDKIRSITSGERDDGGVFSTKISQEITSDEAGERDEPLSARMIREVITDLTMHEVGHTLGLAHNFAGSRYRPHGDIHNREKTNGVLSASVMDYLPINFAPPETPQGDFANTHIGPYDIWAIKFGYDPDVGDDGALREEVLQKAGLPGYRFNSYGLDPSVFAFDLTDNPAAYALDNLRLAENIITDSNNWSLRENTESNLEIFVRVLGMRERAFVIMLAQLQPYRLEIDRSFERSGRNRIVKAFSSKSQQLASLDALEDGIFANKGWAVPVELNKRLGVYSFSAATLDGGQLAFSENVIRRLVSFSLVNRLSNADKLGADGLGVDEYFAKLREIIFADDLGPLGRPSASRRAQQYLYANQLSILLSRLDTTIPYLGLLNLDRLELSRHVEKEINRLKRDLRLPYFWLPEEYKQHRELLRETLQ